MIPFFKLAKGMIVANGEGNGYRTGDTIRVVSAMITPMLLLLIGYFLVNIYDDQKKFNITHDQALNKTITALATLASQFDDHQQSDSRIDNSFTISLADIYKRLRNVELATASRNNQYLNHDPSQQ